MYNVKAETIIKISLDAMLPERGIKPERVPKNEEERLALVESFKKDIYEQAKDTFVGIGEGAQETKIEVEVPVLEIVRVDA